MGYTRYWERTEKEITFRFVNDVQNILDDCKERGIIIKDGAGENAPVVNMDRIWINGNSKRYTLWQLIDRMISVTSAGYAWDVG